MFVADLYLTSTHPLAHQTLANGDSITGSWLRGHITGACVKRFSSGDVHRGWYAHDCRHGFGTYTWHTGDRFDGFWLVGTQEGRGTYTRSDGTVSLAFFRCGVKHGRALVTRDGITFMELWADGVRLARILLNRLYPTRLLRTLPRDASSTGATVPGAPTDPAAAAAAASAAAALSEVAVESLCAGMDDVVGSDDSSETAAALAASPVAASDPAVYAPEGKLPLLPPPALDTSAWLAAEAAPHGGVSLEEGLRMFAPRLRLQVRAAVEAGVVPAPGSAAAAAVRAMLRVTDGTVPADDVMMEEVLRTLVIAPLQQQSEEAAAAAAAAVAETAPPRGLDFEAAAAAAAAVTAPASSTAAPGSLNGTVAEASTAVTAATAAAAAAGSDGNGRSRNDDMDADEGKGKREEEEEKESAACEVACATASLPASASATSLPTTEAANGEDPVSAPLSGATSGGTDNGPTPTAMSAAAAQAELAAVAPALADAQAKALELTERIALARARCSVIATTSTTSASKACYAMTNNPPTEDNTSSGAVNAAVASSTGKKEGKEGACVREWMSDLSSLRLTIASLLARQMRAQEVISAILLGTSAPATYAPTGAQMRGHELGHRSGSEVAGRVTRALVQAASSAHGADSRPHGHALASKDVGVRNDADGLCKVCYGAEIDCILIRCGHMATCMRCSDQLEKCPICRAHIDDVVRAFRA